MTNVDLWIGGASRAASSGLRFERAHPVSGKVVSRAAAASVADASAAVAAAKAAFPAWAALGPNERRTQLLDAAERLRAAGGDLIGLMMAETGAAKAWAEFNLRLACSMLREAASMTTQIDGQVIPSDKPGLLSMAVRVPHGVVLGIAPWNAPIILCTRAFAMPLACGNTVVLKTSELCPATHALLARAVAEALPPGVLNTVSNAPADAAEVVGSLIAHADVRHVNFTGSSHVGRVIGEQAGRHLKPVLLELGGKSPMLVLDDADIDAAVNAAAFGAFMHSGQICMSTERLVVHEKVADEFAARLAAKIASLPVGDPSGGGKVVLGPLIGMQAADRVVALIDDAVAHGAKRLCGGKREGPILDGTVLDHVTPAMKIYAAESFGPVIGIVRVKNDDEAVCVANDTEYGLSAAVFSRDIVRAMKIARRIESGICHINGPTVQDEAQIPFGGVKASGVGRFGGRAGVDAFTQLRWMTIETEAPHYPF